MYLCVSNCDPCVPQALNAEIVVIFEGITELGDSFMVRQSYLAQEIHWGHVFVPIVKPAPEGEMMHVVDVARCAGANTTVNSCTA